MWLRLILGLLAVMAGAPVLAAEDPLRLEGKIALGNVVGRIDHLAIDLNRQRLLISELGNNSLGVVDIPAAKLLKRVTGLSEPQGVGYEPSSDRVYVANAGDGTVKILAAETLSPVGVIKLGEDADNVRIESPDRVLVGYGNGAIAVLQSGKRTADLPLAAHPESFQLDPSGDRLFVNEPEATRVGVIERKTGREIGRWRVPGAGANSRWHSIRPGIASSSSTALLRHWPNSTPEAKSGQECRPAATLTMSFSTPSASASTSVAAKVRYRLSQWAIRA
jgi:hypothetical protein